MRLGRDLLTGLGWVFACVFSLFGCASAVSPASAGPRGRPVGDATAWTRTPVVWLDGTSVAFRDAARGRPLLVSPWAPWCDGCLAEMEALGRIHREATAHGSAVLAIAVGEPHEKIRGWVARHPVPFDVAVDEGFVLSDALGSKRLPTLLVVDREGVVRHVSEAPTDATLEALRAAWTEARERSVGAQGSPDGAGGPASASKTPAGAPAQTIAGPRGR